MKALVIGGNRFFGLRLVKLLAEKGHEVTVFNRGNFPINAHGLPIRNVIGDRNNPQALTSILKEKWDVVYDQVCFEAPQALQLSELLKGQTERLIFTSSQAVYPTAQLHLGESQFDPFKFSYNSVANCQTHYGEAKRQCEAVYARMFPQNSVFVRFPFVVGPDDYTERLHWHVRAIKAGAPIFFPSLDAQVSFIHSADAAQVLSFVGEAPISGPVNASAPDCTTFGDIVKKIESICGKSAILADSEGQGQLSVFGWRHSCSMSVERLASFGHQIPPLKNWLGELIEIISSN